MLESAAAGDLARKTRGSEAGTTGLPGSAPGIDGLPVDMYRSFKHIFISLLSRILFAIGSAGSPPPRFNDRLIVTIYKKGDQADPSNHRPITLPTQTSASFTSPSANTFPPISHWSRLPSSMIA